MAPKPTNAAKAQVTLISKRKRPTTATKPSSGKQVEAADEFQFESDHDGIDLLESDLDQDEQEPDSDQHDQEESDQDDHEEFPEIDPGLSDEDSVELEDSQAENEDDDDEEEEEGYNSSDIDNWDSAEEDERADEFAARNNVSETLIQQELNRMVQRAIQKPDEEETGTNVLGIDRNIAAVAFSKDRNPDGSARGIFQRSAITGEMKRVYPEIEADYDSDSSTEEAPNRVGNVPLEWYDDLPHIGYDVNGRKVMRPATKDELDKFLATVDGDGDAWFSAKDQATGQDVKLSDEELDIIRRLQNAEIPDDAYDPYEDQVEWFTGAGKEMITGLSGAPEPKRRFVPSKWEHKKVMKIVRAIRQGRIVPHAPKDIKPQFYNIWSDADEQRADHPMHMPAPKLALPGHAESYNPPAEYLFNEEENKDWQEADREDRKLSFVPSKHSALRLVPGYQNFVQERFERCLDLYLAPRMRKKRLDLTDPESLIPKLPSPKDLRPFPTTTSIIYPHEGAGRVRSVSIDPTGVWIVTGADDGKVRLWDLAAGRLTASWDINHGIAKSEQGPVLAVRWSPNKSHALFVATTNARISIIAPPQCTPSSDSATSSPSFLFATQGFQPQPLESSSNNKAPVKWTRPTESERRLGVAAHIQITNSSASSLKTVTWHSKGDYFATVSPSSSAGSFSVLIHQLSRHRSQAPFRKASRGSCVQSVVFHPTKPHLFLATQRYIRLYDLATQSLLKTLQSGFRWISCLDIHSSGDHLLVGSYDKKVAWFDLDLSTKPFKILRYHQRAIRQVSFASKSFSLFADGSDDSTIQLFYSNVSNSNDFNQNTIIVPLTILRGHQVKYGLGVLDLQWHPSLPWLVSAAADGQVRLWTV